MKRMIFHYPAPIIEAGHSASTIRPKRMIDAFKNIGYDVFIVTGYGEERSQRIKEVKRQILEGAKFEFVYSESLTLPTLLAEKNHLPTYPFLDFNFFKFCKNNNIKVGLFYRDIYWRFKELYKPKSILHKMVAVSLYYYDLYKYRDLDNVFIPSNEMSQFIPLVQKNKFVELPPGTDLNIVEGKQKDDFINVLYVGGFTDSYPMELLLQAVSKCDYIKLVICTRENEWEEFKKHNFIPTNVSVAHEKGQGLKDLYKNADICSLVFEPQQWRSFAFPFKFFEYLSYGKPVLAINNTPPSRIINEFSIGWNVDYSLDELINIFDFIKNSRFEIQNKINNINMMIGKCTWESRATKVENHLISRN